MEILLTILFILLKVIIGILVLLVIILLLPFKYTFDASYIDKELNIYLKYIIFPLHVYANTNNKLEFKGTLWKKVLFESKKEVKTIEKNSIGDTDFIVDKYIEESIEETDKDAKRLFLRAKKYEKDLKSKNKSKDKAKKEKVSFTTKLKRFMPSNIIYVIRLVFREGFKISNRLKPTKMDVSIKLGYDNPFKTGLVLAALGPISVFRSLGFNIGGCFNKSIFEGTIHATRRICLIYVLMPAIRVLLDKRFRSIAFKK